MFMKLRDWIDEEKIDWYNLSLNSNAIDLITNDKLLMIND